MDSGTDKLSAAKDGGRDRAGARTLIERVYSTHGELWSSILAGVLLLAALLCWMAEQNAAAEVLQWISLGIGLVHGVRAAWLALAERKVDIDVLMVVGAVVAAVIGHPGEGALLLFLFVLAGALEELAMQRTQREVEALHALMPTEALVLRDGEWLDVEPADLKVGERIKVRPGQRVPTDAIVVQGRSSLDQSAITGESIPRAVDVGDEIYAGTINSDDTLEATVSKAASESSLQRVLALVTQAREQREPVQRAIDRFSEPYALGVIGLSAVVFLVWWVVLGRTLDSSAMTAITVLIVASPCALVIATPTATLAAIARGARAGVLFKGGQAIQRLANIGAVCFDKTGTLTFGKPRMERIIPAAWSDGNELLAVAAALEADSTHPIATAIKDAATKQGIAPATLDRVDHTAGRGLSGVQAIAGVSREVRLGSMKHVEPATPQCLKNHVRQTLEGIQQRGQIGVVVAREGSDNAIAPDAGQAAVIVLVDAVRPGAHTLVTELHALGVRPVRMLTGDNRFTAARVAEQLGLDQFDAELMPQDKLNAVAQMKAQQRERAKGKMPRGVAVIGDGVNDAPALAAADLGIAIGSIGSDAALESADIVLLSDELTAVPWAVRLARRARQTVVANLSIAIGIIALMAIATLVGSYMDRPVPLGIGVLAHEGGTLLVVANSLRLLVFGAWAPAPAEDRFAVASIEIGKRDATAIA